MLTTVFGKIENDISGTCEIVMDSTTAIKYITDPLTASKAAKPGGEIWSGIKRLFRKYNGITFTMTWTKDHPVRRASFQEDKYNYLICRCHDIA